MSDDERHASNLELFLDLVFVFAVTQIASLIDSDLTAAGVARGVLIAALVWWQWSQFTWAGSAINLQRRVSTRVLVLCTIPATLTMAVSIPHAFGASDGPDTGAWFGIAYLVVQLLVLAMQGTTAVRDPATRKAFIDYTSLASIAPVLVAAVAHRRVGAHLLHEPTPVGPFGARLARAEHAHGAAAGDE